VIKLENLGIRIQTLFDSVSEETRLKGVIASLQKQPITIKVNFDNAKLNQLSSTLKQAYSSANQQQVKGNPFSQYEQGLNKLINNYKMLKITSDQFKASIEKMTAPNKAGLFDELSLSKQQQVIKLIAQAEKEVTTNLTQTKTMQDAITKASESRAKAEAKTADELRISTNQAESYYAKQEQQRLATMTNMQKQIENMVTNSNKTITETSVSMSQKEANSYVQFWTKALNQVDTQKQKSQELLSNTQMNKIMDNMTSSNPEIEKMKAFYMQQESQQLSTQSSLYNKLNILIKEQYSIEKQILTNKRLKNESTVRELQNQLEINRASQQQVKDTISSSNLTSREKESKLTETTQKEQNKLNVATQRYNDILARTDTGIFKKIGDTIVHNIKAMAQWAISGTLIFGTFREIKEGIQIVNDLNKSLTDIRIVTGQSQEAIESLGKSYNNLAKDIGATTKEVLNSSIEWYRQGKSSSSEVSQLITASMVESKLAAIDSAQATEYLTSVLNGYQMKTSEVMSVIDKMVAIDNSAATSVSELSEALQRSSNSASQAGVSYDELLSYVGTISSVTRKSAESIGKFCLYVQKCA
jgi:hypothetical protein